MFASLALLLTVATPTTDIPTRPITTPPPENYRWYGAPAAVADAASLGLLTGSLFAGGRDANGNWSMTSASTALMFGGLLGQTLVAPMNHLANRHPGRAAISLAARLLPPLLFVLSQAGGPGGCSASGCDPQQRPSLFWLVLFGSVMIIDDGSARDPIPQSPQRIGFVPGVALGNRTAALSLTGAF